MQFLRRGIRLFRLLGVSVHLDYSWFIFFFLVVWTFGRFYFPTSSGGLSPMVSWSLATAAAMLLFFSVIFHEMSHAVVSTHLGFPIKRITLFIFGGVAHMSSEPDKPRTEFLVAGAGPVSSIVLAGGFLILSLGSRSLGQEPLFTLFAIVAQLNFMLAVFNLVPGFPLDGGRLLRALIWWKTRSLKKATGIAARIGEGFAYLLMVFGVILIFADRPGGWISGVWYILIGIFVKNAAEQSYEHVLIEEVLEGIHVAEIMGHNPMSVKLGDSLDDLIEGKFLQHKFTEYPVVDLEGKVVGVIDIDHVKNIPRAERDDRAVKDLMQPLSAAQLPTPSSTAVDALREMLTQGAARLPVIDDGGKLAGIISRGDIMRMFQIRSDLGEELVV